MSASGDRARASPIVRLLGAFKLLGVTIAAVLGASISPRTAVAHDVGITSVARVFIDHVGEGRYILSIVDVGLPALDDTSSSRLLPAHCRLSRVGDALSTGRALTVPTLPFDCDGELTLDDVITLPWDLAGVVVVFRWMDGSDASAYFRGRGRSVTIRLGDLRAGEASRLQLVGRYSLLGAEHILFGVDHLLFVLGLLLLVHGVGSLVATITAFTFAHSLTLGAAVLGVIAVDRGAVEAAIAISIVLLAREIVVGHGGRRGLVHERPWLVALVFGLLHGFGFAGALGEIGLRSADVPLALFSFNLGGRGGQLVNVAVLLLLHAVSRGSIRPRSQRLVPAVGYALGALATLWFFDRLPGVWGV